MKQVSFSETDRTYITAAQCVCCTSGLVCYQTMKCRGGRGKSNEIWLLKSVGSSLFHLSFAIILKMGFLTECSTVHKIKSGIGAPTILCFTSLLKRTCTSISLFQYSFFNKYTIEYNLALGYLF